jgi:hypothetical protein
VTPAFRLTASLTAHETRPAFDLTHAVSRRFLCGMFWRELFDEIKLDIPRERLRKQLLRVEDAIYSRLEEIAKNPYQACEREAIEETLAKIRHIQVERLGFSGIPKSKKKWGKSLTGSAEDGPD